MIKINDIRLQNDEIVIFIAWHIGNIYPYYTLHPVSAKDNGALDKLQNELINNASSFYLIENNHFLKDKNPNLCPDIIFPNGELTSGHLSSSEIASNFPSFNILILELLYPSSPKILLDRDISRIKRDREHELLFNESLDAMEKSSKALRESTDLIQQTTDHLNQLDATLNTIEPSYRFLSLPSAFLIRLLSHPATPVLGVILLIAGVALAASGAGIILGSCLAVVGVAMLAGHARTKFSLFPRYEEPQREDNHELLNKLK